LTLNQSQRIILWPTRVELSAPAGTPLRDLLFDQGVEFPCGGQGRCRGCRIRVLNGKAEVNRAQQERLSPEEIASGWRLACQCVVEGDLEIELRQWDAAILVDDTVFAFRPRQGLGVAVDLGTTTLVAQLLDLATGRVLAVSTALNAQARYGADVMSRLHFAVLGGGQHQLETLIRQQIGALIEQLLFSAGKHGAEIADIVVVGNTVMHHFFCGIDAEPLAHYPFEPAEGGLQPFRSSALGWKHAGDPLVRFLPCLGGFVGSDVLAGILATKLLEHDELVGLIDLGTNGEIVIGNKDGLLCASTAAGPAFEGAKISMGMRASTGAISQVTVIPLLSEEGTKGWCSRDRVHCHVIGDGAPRGLCGSGLVDAVAAGLELGVIATSGRFSNGESSWMLAPPVALTQNDIRELQLAKAAIAAGIKLLMQRKGAKELTRLYLAGAFGNYIDRASAQGIGLIDFPPERVEAAGNTALLGAKLALFSLDSEDGSYVGVRRRVEHVALNADPNFQDVFVEELAFPQATPTSIN
jgi:uncharacterized 2Fe-2S/4Fe-4S cluster protein (DUF4445 family)